MNLARHYASPLEGMRTASPPPGATHRDLPRFDQLYAKQQPRETSAEAQDLLRSQELFLSVVLDWQRHDMPQHAQVQRVQHYAEPAYSSSFESSEGSDHEGGQALLRFTKAPHKPIVDDPSPTNLPRVHHMPLTHPSGPPALSLNNLLPVPSKKIGVYTPRSRRVLIEKYMEKRTKRLSRKKVRYRVRKTLANARPRVKGRFVKTEQPLTAAAVEEMEKRQQQPSAAHASDAMDYLHAFFELEKRSRADVTDMLGSITTLMRRRNHDINWEDLSANLEQSMLALLPRQHNESPLPDVQAELINLLADAEDEGTQETYIRALHGCALYVALCLSLYASLRHPSLWDMDDESSPVMHHYLADIKQLWLRRKTKKQQTVEAFEGTVHGLAAVICLGYDDAKRYLKPLTL